MKFFKWLFRKKPSQDLLQYSMYNFPYVIPQQYLASVGVLEAGMPEDWYSNDGNGKVDA